MNPIRPHNVSNDAQFIFGIGASAWFLLYQNNNNYIIERYSETGSIECSRTVTISDKSLDINQPYQFTYPSNCKECTVIQNNKKYIFKAIKYEN